MNGKRTLRNGIAGICALILFFLLFAGSAFADGPAGVDALHVEDGLLADADGQAVQLRGVSTHGLTWYPGFVSEDRFRQLAEDWDANLIRLAMYSETYCGGEREASEDLMKKGIDAAIANDLYVLVDWHILEDDNPISDDRTGQDLEQQRDLRRLEPGPLTESA